MSMQARWLCVVAPLLLSACATMAQEERPAVLVTSDAEVRTQIVLAVAAALGNANVTLAPDALTTQSVLAIERTPARDATGQRLSGRDYGRPEQFQLVKQGERCVLVHSGSQQRYELKGAQCVEEGK